MSDIKIAQEIMDNYENDLRQFPDRKPPYNRKQLAMNAIAKALSEQRSLLKQKVEGAMNLYCDIADAEEKANWTRHCTCLKAAARAVKEAFDEPV